VRSVAVSLVAQEEFLQGTLFRVLVSFEVVDDQSDPEAETGRRGAVTSQMSERGDGVAELRVRLRALDERRRVPHAFHGSFV
jgi:hypothetical protein